MCHRTAHEQVLLTCLKFLTIISAVLTQENADNRTPFKFISGVYAEELPSPIFYESYAPIILKYQLPNWNKSEVTFNNWYSCITETAPFRYTCPVVYYMNKAILNLHIDFESIQPVQDSQAHDEFYSKLFANSEFCDSIQKHFSGIFIQDNELDKYLESLEQCHLGSSSSYTDMVISTYNFSIRHPFTKIENNFYNTFYKNINSSFDLVASATLSNARATIQATLLSAYYAEKYRWTHAVQDCRSQVIPHSVVTYAKFNESITQLAGSLGLSNTGSSTQDLSIPLDLISKYYNLPLTDCTFTQDSFLTRILIPIRSKSTKVQTKKLFKLNAVPFLYSNRLCQVQLDYEVEENHVYDTERKLAYKTKCVQNELCQIAGVFMPLKIDPCVSAILSEDFDEFVKNCPFKCYDRPVVPQALISRVKSDTYVVVGSVKALFNNMGNQIPFQKEIQIGSDEYYVGAVEVTLPCKSKLTIEDKILYSEKPCNENGTYSVVTVAPWHLAKANDANNIDEILLENYVFGGFQRHEHSSDDAVPSRGPIVDNSSSQAFIWVFFSLVCLILFAVQVFTLWQISRQHGGGGPRRAFQNMFYTVRERNQEPEFRLMNE